MLLGNYGSNNHWTGCDGLTVDPIKLKIKVTNKLETWGGKYETSQLSKGQGSHFVLSIFTFMIN